MHRFSVVSSASLLAVPAASWTQVPQQPPKRDGCQSPSLPRCTVSCPAAAAQGTSPCAASAEGDRVPFTRPALFQLSPDHGIRFLISRTGRRKPWIVLTCYQRELQGLLFVKNESPEMNPSCASCKVSVSNLAPSDDSGRTWLIIFPRWSVLTDTFCTDRGSFSPPCE